MDNQNESTTLFAARSYLAHGLSVIPVKANKKSPAISSWTAFQQTLAIDAQLTAWFGDANHQPAIVCGDVSGGAPNQTLVAVDFDNLAERDAVLTLLPSWLAQMPAKAQTPRPGEHWLFRCPSDCEVGQILNGALASAADGSSLIDIKTTGGYIVAPGGSDSQRVFVNKNAASIPILSADQAKEIVEACRQRNQSPQPASPATQASGEPYRGEPRPGDLLDAITTTDDVVGWLESFGWQVHTTAENDPDGKWQLTRPGKNTSGGSSATLDVNESEVVNFRTWSTNATPFATNRTYTPFGMFAAIYAGGDEAKAASIVANLYADQLAAAKASYQAANVSDTGGLFKMGLSDVQTEAINWLWYGRLALGKLAAINGDGGVGKGIFTCDAAARISTGNLWPDGQPCQLGHVFFVGSEDGIRDTVAPRLYAAGANPSNVSFLAGPVPPDKDYPTRLDLQKHFDKLYVAIAAQSNAKVLVIDPVMDHLGDNTDANSAKDVREVLSPLRGLAEKFNISVVLVNHLNKDSKGRSKHRGLGSGAFSHVVRVELRVTEDQDDKERKLLLPVKNNLASPAGLAYRIESSDHPKAHGAGRCVWEEDPVDITIEDAEAAPVDSEAASKIEEAMAWLSAQLSEGPMAAKDLRNQAKADGQAWRTIERAKKKINATASQADGEWKWHPPATGLILPVN